MILLPVMLFNIFMEYDKYLTVSNCGDRVCTTKYYIFDLSVCDILGWDLANSSPASDVKIDL